MDLNLDCFPEMIIVTFVEHGHVLKALEQRDHLAYWEYRRQTSSAASAAAAATVSNGGVATPHAPSTWTLQPSKIDFTCHVRNCSSAEETIPNKFLPIYVLKDKLKLASQYLEQQ